MITLERLCKSYGPVAALKELSLSVEAGEIVGLLGPNGAGKTTAMKIITCYMPPTSGSVTVDGRDTVAEALEVRRRIGYLPENNPLYHEMSVAEYLDFAARLHGMSRQAAPRAIARAVGQCGLGDLRHRLIGHLSKGFRQRVGLAQAILHDPDVLIMDEPTSGLDPNQIQEIRQLIKELGRAKTVILSTHIMQEVEAVCSRVLIIDRGRIVANDTAENLLRQRAGTVRYTLEIDPGGRGALAVEETLRARLPLAELDAHALDGVLRLTLTPASGEDLRAPLFRLAVAEGWELLELGRTQNTLEDVFRELTTGHEQEAAA
jgi:ABC-2 type transport system ATP-binding protein